MISDNFKNVNPFVFSSFYLNKNNLRKNKFYIKSFNYNFIKLAIKESFFFLIQKILNKKINLDNFNNYFFSVTNKKSQNQRDEFFGSFHNNFQEMILIIVDIKIGKVDKKGSISLIAQLSLIEFYEIIIEQYKILKFYYFKYETKRNDFLNLLYEIKNLLNSYSISKIVSKMQNACSIYYIFENEPWERALLMSSSYNKKIKHSYAYTHTLISKNNHNYVNLNNFIEGKYIPRDVIFTGRYNLLNFLKISNLDTKKNNINFFYTNINKLNKNLELKNNPTKKVLFLIDDIKYLNKIYDIIFKLIENNQFEVLYSYNIHDRKLKRAIEKLNFSKMTKLDLRNKNYINVSIVAYNSTSLALEFYKKGYQLAYFNYYNDHEYDPLMRTTYNKSVFSNYEDILRIYYKKKNKINYIKLTKEYLKYFGNNTNFKFYEISQEKVINIRY